MKKDREQESKETNEKIVNQLRESFFKNSLEKNKAFLENPPKDANMTELGFEVLKSVIAYQEKAKEEKDFLSDPELILRIHEEISKTHLLDDAVKLTTFLCMCSAYLEPQERRKSIALKGSRSVGKDNLIKTCLSLFPEDDYIFLTDATKATLQDDIQPYKIIAFSEINLTRDDKGANALILETIKQLTEGGISALKKDLLANNKLTKHSKQDQKTVIYSTTESESDDELNTRFIVGSVEASPDKIRIVNKNTLNSFAGLVDAIPDDNRIKRAIHKLKENCKVILPYLDEIPVSFFDNQDSRAMRDLKRLLSLACVVAWLHQEQRQKNEKNEILGLPEDLAAAIIISKAFFNLSYSGLADMRQQRTINAINEICDNSGKDIFARSELQRKMGLSLNTVKGCLKGVINLSIVKYAPKEGNEIMLERCQKGVKKLLIGVKWREVLSFLEGVKGVKINQKTLETLEKLEKVCQNSIYPDLFLNFDTFELTPLTPLEKLKAEIIAKPERKLTIENVLLLGYSQENIETWKKEGHLFENPAGFLRAL